MSFQEVDDTGNVNVEFVRGSGMGGGIGSILYSDRDPTGGGGGGGGVGALTREYFTYNAVGHTVALTDALGNVTKTTTYEAFGNEAASTGSSDNNRLANTKERDFSIGLDNHGYRYYDPSSGRYITRDPIGYGDGPNVYAHVQNNPVHHVDPLGLEFYTSNSDGSHGVYFANGGRGTYRSVGPGEVGTFLYVAPDGGEVSVNFGPDVPFNVVRGFAANSRATHGLTGQLKRAGMIQAGVEAHNAFSPGDPNVAAGLGSERKRLADGEWESELIAAVALGGAVAVASTAFEPIDWVLTGFEIIRDPANPASYAGLAPFVATGMAKMSNEMFDVVAAGALGRFTHIPSSGRKANQISQRGWSRADIHTLVNNPFATRTSLNARTGNAATVFYEQGGAHVIRDDVTGELVQLSDRVNPQDWIPDKNIVDPYLPE